MRFDRLPDKDKSKYQQLGGLAIPLSRKAGNSEERLSRFRQCLHREAWARKSNRWSQPRGFEHPGTPMEARAWDTASGQTATTTRRSIGGRHNPGHADGRDERRADATPAPRPQCCLPPALTSRPRPARSGPGGKKSNEIRSSQTVIFCLWFQPPQPPPWHPSKDAALRPVENQRRTVHKYLS